MTQDGQTHTYVLSGVSAKLSRSCYGHAWGIVSNLHKEGGLTTLSRVISGDDTQLQVPRGWLAALVGAC